MHKKILIKTNLFISLVIIIGFATIFAVNYRVNLDDGKTKIEHICELTSETIYYRLEALFAKPLYVSLTMANDSLLKDYLLNETDNNDDSFVQGLQNYLYAYKEKYEYDSVFLASAKTGRYYNFNGIDRILTAGNPENDWYFNFLDADEDYSLNIDNDEAALNEITVFINCIIKDDTGGSLGIVGVGFRIDSMQKLFGEYADSHGVDIYIIDEIGNIEIAIDETGWQPVNFFDVCGYSHLKDEILHNHEADKSLSYWHPEQGGQNYILSRYIRNAGWHLIVEHNTSLLIALIFRRLYALTIVMIVTVAIAIVSVTLTVNRYHRQIIELTSLMEREKHAAVKRELTRKAEIDGQTGIYNKKATEYYISQMLEYNPDNKFAFIILDIDNLKQINDRHGHSFGDLAINKFASIIKNAFRESDITGRIGGDEFVVFLPFANIELFENKVDSLSKSLSTECSDGRVSCPISASIGVALAPGEGTDFNTLYKNADTALYDTKKKGKNGYKFYNKLK